MESLSRLGKLRRGIRDVAVDARRQQLLLMHEHSRHPYAYHNSVPCSAEHPANFVAHFYGVVGCHSSVKVHCCTQLGELLLLLRCTIGVILGVLTSLAVSWLIDLMSLGSIKHLDATALLIPSSKWLFASGIVASAVIQFMVNTCNSGCGSQREVSRQHCDRADRGTAIATA